MFSFDKNYREYLHAAWNHFVNNEHYDYSFLRPEILASWQRSRNFSVDPYHIKTSVLSGEALNKRINANLTLIEVVRPYMEKLFSIVEGSGFYLLLSDQEGYILDLIGDKDIISAGEKNSRLVIGANRSERFAGTNAIGTCLAIQMPIQIWNEEHYNQHHKPYVCSGAPIYGAAGNLLGCLNLTGHHSKVHTHTLGMVISAVDGVSKEMKIRNAYEEIKIISAQRNSIIESTPSGLILLNMSDRIVQINSKALSMLHLKYEKAIGRNIFELAEFDEFSKEGVSFTGLSKKVYNKETNITLLDSPLPPVKFNMSIDFVEIGRDERGGTLIGLSEPRLINRLVNRISGFKSTFTFDSIIGSSISMREMLNMAKQAAKSDSTVLVLGESGTGKELIAQSLHNASSYCDGPFVAINCGALPNGLIESELFGYERGSFTGASNDGNPGKFELADGGTIFLDEIGDMPLDVQISLLRVLQTKEVVRIGAKYPKQIDVRIVAATNSNLLDAIDARTFRQDLYYRLNVFNIHVPPLRERGHDISILAQYFIDSYNLAKGASLTLDPSILPILESYPWPGNVRELENAMERAVNITTEREIQLKHLPSSIISFADKLSGHDETAKPGAALGVQIHPALPGLKIEETNRQLILSALAKTGGNVKATAELLGISRRTLYRKLEKYNIDCNKYR